VEGLAGGAALDDVDESVLTLILQHGQSFSLKSDAPSLKNIIKRPLIDPNITKCHIIVRVSF